MRIKYFKPFVPEQLSSLGLPTDPTDSQGLAALPTETLQELLDQVYGQLDTDFPSLDAADWYTALSETLNRRTLVAAGLGRPA